MIRLAYYKLPDENGENVLITTTQLYLDSELAIMVDEEDLGLTFFDLYYDGTEEPTIMATEVEDDYELPMPWFLIDEDSMEATLPFKNIEEARKFCIYAWKMQQKIEAGFDA